MSCVHIGDEGTIFRITLVDKDGLPIPVHTSTLKQIRFQKPEPDLTVLIKTAEFYTDGTDGVIQYTTVTGDIDYKGQWRIQGYVELPSGKYSSKIGEFPVLEILS